MHRPSHQKIFPRHKVNFSFGTVKHLLHIIIFYVELSHTLYPVDQRIIIHIIYFIHSTTVYC